ncbi:1-acyl-sn-glycerol-3-phosphate acyltransferase [Calothrix rhizosoleniae]|uniref:1-acyl-sn-glycerol-3-phosphate acyltransferase n=1 Tax=Calothrix rhizosoleniae TaxID=888997 RepID=UPI000B4A0D1D
MAIKNLNNNLISKQEKTLAPGYQFSWFDWFCLWYPPGWLILFNRHWQHYHTDPDGWNWLEYGLFLLPEGFYIALLVRWLRFSFASLLRRLFWKTSPPKNHNKFDPNYQQAFHQEILKPIVEYYFQAELQQIENLPNSEPLIVVMNHAGMCFPWDFLTLGYLLTKTRNWVVQPVAGLSLFDHPWVTWWLPSGWSQVLGAVKAEINDFTHAMEKRKIILYAPEGLRGPRKGWKKRYQLPTFDGSFMQLSQRNQIPILPVICIGNENLHPWTINVKKLQKLFSLPFLPVSPLMPIFLLFPSMGIWAMKSHLRYHIQPLIQTQSHPQLPNSRTQAYQAAQMLKVAMQSQLDNLLQK